MLHHLRRGVSAGLCGGGIGGTLAAFHDILDACLAGTHDAFFPASDEVESARQAGSALYRYALADAQHDAVTATRLQAEIWKLVPEVILATESQGSGADLTEARQALAGLRGEQERVHQRLEEMAQRLRKMQDSVEGLR